MTHMQFLIAIIGIFLTILSIPDKYIDDMIKDYVFMAFSIGGWLFSLLITTENKRINKEMREFEKRLNEATQEIATQKTDISRFSQAFEILSKHAGFQIEPTPRIPRQPEKLDMVTNDD